MDLRGTKAEVSTKKVVRGRYVIKWKLSLAGAEYCEGFPLQLLRVLGAAWGRPQQPVWRGHAQRDEPAAAEDGAGAAEEEAAGPRAEEGQESADAQLCWLYGHLILIS